MAQRTLLETSFCDRTHQLLDRLPRHSFPFDKARIPRNGIYFLYEEGEPGHEGLRIVRVGTDTGEKQLRSRLKQHFLLENKDRSIFRKNIGRAMLSMDKDPFLREWEIDLTPTQAKKAFSGLIDPAKRKEVEKKVTEYIQKHFQFSVVRCDDKQKRLHLESRIISTVSLCPECRPSPDWLGLFSPKRKIRESGLWQVNELYKRPMDEDDFETLRSLAERTLVDNSLI